jgi:hypothetical protein
MKRIAWGIGGALAALVPSIAMWGFTKLQVQRAAEHAGSGSAGASSARKRCPLRAFAVSQAPLRTRISTEPNGAASVALGDDALRAGARRHHHVAATTSSSNPRIAIQVISNRRCQFRNSGTHLSVVCRVQLERGSQFATPAATALLSDATTSSRSACPRACRRRVIHLPPGDAAAPVETGPREN